MRVISMLAMISCYTQIHEAQKMGYTFHKARDIVQTSKRYKTAPVAVIQRM